jgi:GntR family transcriptional regulator/MocR family aminotransferase
MACDGGVRVNIPLDRERPVPLARQIQSHLERLIGDGLLAPGVKLPATRELAQRLGVNRATVALAYEELVAGGLARAHVGQGTFVAGEPVGRAVAAPLRAAPIDWTSLLSRSARVAAAEEERRRALSPAGAPAGAISFAGGMPDSALFPTDAFRRVLNQVVREEGEALLQYSPVGGYAPLRRYLAGYLLRFGVEARAEEILVVNGSQQGFDLIARTLVDPGDTVACSRSARSAPGWSRWSGTRPAPGPTCSSGSASGRRPSCSTASPAPTTPPGWRCRPRWAGGCWPPPRATRSRSSRTASTAACTTGRGRPRP